MPALFVPTTEPEYHTYIQNTRIMAPNGLWVSGAFRYYADPYPGVNDKIYGGVYMFSIVNESDDNHDATAVWHCTDESDGPETGPHVGIPEGQGSYFIVVQIDFSLPTLPITEMNTVDVRVLPHVQRSAANLLDHSLTPVEYDRLNPGTYVVQTEEVAHTGWFQYKRIVQGTREHTTMRDVWTAVWYIEGWDPRQLQRIFESHTEIEAAIADRTVYDEMTSISLSELDSENDDDDAEHDKEIFWRNGGRVVRIAWPTV